jgi:trimeric autotransporter adhesin
MATANTRFKTHYGLQANSNSFVDGDFTINGDLAVNGSIAFQTLSGLSGDFFPNEDQKALGNSSLRWNLSAFTANVGSTLNVVNAATMANSLNVTGPVTFSNVLVVSSTANVVGFNASGTANISQNLNVGGSANVGGYVNAGGNVHFACSIFNLTTNNTSNALSIGAANVTMDSGVLFVDATNNRVGINNTAPGVALRVTGDVDISGTANIQSGMVIGNTFSVTGNVSFVNGLITANPSAIALGSANLNVDTGVFFVDSVNNRVGVNNTAPGSTLRVTGDIDVSTTANVQGDTSLRGNLTVNGSVAVPNTISVGNTTVTGFINTSSTANIGGATTLRSTLTVNGAVTVANTISTGNTEVTGYINVSSTANIGGATTLRTTLTVDGNSSISNGLIAATSNSTVNSIAFGAGNVTFDTSVLFVDSVNNRVGINNTAPGVALRVTGDTDITGSANIQGTVFARGGLTVNGVLTIANTVLVGNTEIVGFMNVSSTANVGGATNLRSTLTVNGATTIANTIAVGNTEITGYINATSTANVGGATNLRSTLTVNGAVTIANTIAVGNTTITGSANVSGNVGLVGSLFTVTNDNRVTVGAANVSVDSGVFFVDATNNRVGLNNSTPTVSLTITGTDAILLPVGNTTQRPTAAVGLMRFNSEALKPEVYYSGTWNSFITSGELVGNSEPVVNTLAFRDANADLYANNFYSISDVALKENINNINDPLKILSLTGKEYNFKGASRKQYGFVAQDVEKIIPEVVDEKGTLKAINYTQLIAMLVETVKHLEKRISDLEKD